VNEDHSFDSLVRYSERRPSLQKSPPKSLPELVHPQKQDCNELLLIRERIEQLLQERIQKREEGKFLEADTLRNVLWRTYVSLFIGITL
jgi:cysteinyl-tRNA synthetase